MQNAGYEVPRILRTVGRFPNLFSRRALPYSRPQFQHLHAEESGPTTHRGSPADPSAVSQAPGLAPSRRWGATNFVEHLFHALR
jgi:hypothetical protein